MVGTGEGAGSRGQHSHCVGREDGERAGSTLAIPGGSLVIEGCFSQGTQYQRLNL